MASKNLDGNLIKKAHKQQQWTEQHIEELAKCQDPQQGPHYFMNNYFYIQHPTKGKLQYNAYDYQVGLIDAYHNHRFSIAMMGRQLGKCVEKTTLIELKHKDGKMYKMPIEIFYRFVKAVESGIMPPDISSFEK